MELFTLLHKMNEFLFGKPIYVLIIIFAVTVFLFIIVNIRVNRILRASRNLFREAEEKGLDQTLIEYIEHIRLMEHKLKKLGDLVEDIHNDSRRHLQGVGIVRFNAFEDTGGNQSFALALLDSKGDGVALSSLYGRAESRIFAKPVKGGVSEYNLSDEEKTAIQQALLINS